MDDIENELDDPLAETDDEEVAPGTEPVGEDGATKEEGDDDSDDDELGEE